MIENYNDEINRLPPLCRTTVSGVLYACVVTVVGGTSRASGKSAEELDAQFQPASIDEIFSENGEYFRLSTVGSQALFKNLLKTNETLEVLSGRDPMFYEAGDGYSRNGVMQSVHNQRNSSNNAAEDTNNLHATIQGLREFEMNAMIRIHLSRILSNRDNNGFPLRPGMSTVERGIKESELLTFTTLSPTDLYRSNQLQEFTNMILQESKALPNFTGLLQEGVADINLITKRRFFRNLTAFLFAQVLSQESMTEPMILRKYYSMTDEYLMCLHWPPPDRRNKKDHWQHVLTQIVEPPGSKHQQDHSPQSSVVLTGTDSSSQSVNEAAVVPVTAPVSVPAVEGSEGDQTVSISNNNRRSTVIEPKLQPMTVSLDTLTMTPAGNMIAMIKQLNQDTQNPWLSLFINDAILGVRLADKSKSNASVNLRDKSVNDNINMAPTNPTSCNLFYQVDDGTRFTVFEGPAPEPILKPDKLGTVCFLASYPSGLEVLTCSNGDIKITSTAHTMKGEEDLRPRFLYQLFAEKSRLISKGGVILRTFSDSVFSEEILYPDGKRDLYLDTVLFRRYLRNLEINTAPDKSASSGFEMSLLALIPVDTQLMSLLVDGTVRCYQWSEDQQLWVLLTAPNLANILHKKVDAESKSTVSYFQDGRMIVQYTDGCRKVYFPEGSVVLHQPKNNMLYIERVKGFPSVEMDLEIDAMCRGHSLGLEVPINKGGERVRSRIALPDGTAMMIKYDTRVTAKSNGSLKLLRRDKTCILAKDDGSMTFIPASAWDKEV